MVKDKSISVRVDGALWESFKSAATARNTSAADAIDRFMRDYLEMPTQCLPNAYPDSLGNDLADRLAKIEARLDNLESAKVAPEKTKEPKAAIDPDINAAVPRSRDGRINILALAKQLGFKDVQVGRWIRGAASDSPERKTFDAWCDRHPQEHQELIERFTQI